MLPEALGDTCVFKKESARPLNEEVHRQRGFDTNSFLLKLN
jgi:hypothetical protein